MTDSFQNLFARARKGDSNARGELLGQHLPALHAYVRLRSGAMIRGRESISDLVQSVCRQALGDMEEIHCETEEAFKRWLWKLALHKILGKVEYWKAQRRDVARDLSRTGVGQSDNQNENALLAAYAAVYTPSQDAMVREELSRIESAFDQLSDEHKEVILLVRLEGLSHREVADQLGKSEQSVRKLLSRARARLAMLLDATDSA